MARTLLRVAAWAVATALAVTLSWFAVYGVLAGETFDEPSSAVAVDPPSVPPVSSDNPLPGLATSILSSTALPGPPAPPTTQSPAAAVAISTAAPPLAEPAATSPPVTPAPADAATAQSYQLDGGRVVIETTDVDARLVSATPDVGWQVQAWQAEGWLRVDFSRDGTTSSCFVTWNGHPPTVQIT